ncbi:MAG: hypothetical protein RBT60_00230 [Candidatus Krumholzibacteria bacterium]|jgi:hypothetical protein|nr:hypothetical protein [Candidatus Krumholzibacteria bacterium]
MNQQDVPRGRLDPQPSLIKDLLAVLRSHPSARDPLPNLQSHVQLVHLNDRGRQSVPLAAIVGSLNDMKDFDRAFLTSAPGQTAPTVAAPSKGQPPDWPPVKLYLVGGAHFLIDGHRRVATARQAATDSIEAHVWEFHAEVAAAPLSTLAGILAGAAAANFERATGLPVAGEDAIAPTSPAGHDSLLESIVRHRLDLQSSYRRDYPWFDAVRSWQATLYRPVVQVAREHSVLADLPGRTEADFYLWACDRLSQLRRIYGVAEPSPNAGVPSGRWWRRRRQRRTGRK